MNHYLHVVIFYLLQVYTLPEYLGKRFGGQRIRLMVAILFVLHTCNYLMPVSLTTEFHCEQIKLQ